MTENAEAECVVWDLSSVPGAGQSSLTSGKWLVQGSRPAALPPCQNHRHRGRVLVRHVSGGTLSGFQPLLSAVDTIPRIREPLKGGWCGVRVRGGHL